ncbi:hypothetical protein [Janthinobacterium agaricidamnosum]|uniref:Uncharacterized protein n=1 Tax=Janthinobacterium agaricidamnosum NBRC 102515 = DSM 9628 TaxID=1349767 RepID=W0V2W8_9BURK|nr:hypothetical protein [Janthinobacterium agaricidamnosum]CDG81703.1 hypothetical protein GJA_1048 [Janthinobacterium agaricidamnosum NBRC 102515 = DSM 9628]
MSLIALAAVWQFVKPGPGDSSPPNLGPRLDSALVMTADCKLDEARKELAELKTAHATPEQLKRLQKAINDNGPPCEQKRLRRKAWTEAEPAINAALQIDALDRAASRLAAFVRRWDDGPETRKVADKIDLRKAQGLLDEAETCLARSDRGCLENRLIAAERYNRPELAGRIRTLREALSNLLASTLLGGHTVSAAPAQPPQVLNSEPPRQAVPAPSRVISTSPAAAPAVGQSAQQARKILSDAERELGQGNYKSAMDKADICATMIDAGNRECLALKQKAERLNRDMLRCVANGSDWINDRCN